MDLAKSWYRRFVLVLLCIALAAAIYVVHLGNTDSWPEIGCSFAGSRVVRDYVADDPRAIMLYRGEYRLRYTVGAQEYFVWAKSGWADLDRQFIQDKIDSVPKRCNFRVRYNPRHPSEAIAVRK
jgi:hypothetical protein